MERRLSMGQEALWFINRLAPESAAYNVAFALRVHTRLDTVVLSEAATRVAGRHDMLRSVFTEIDGVPRRVVNGIALFRLEVRDVGDVGTDVLAALARAEVARPFELSSGSAARLVLLRRTPDDAVLVFVNHHIAMDLQSQALVLLDLFDAYAALVAGGVPDLGSPAADYDDFVTAERRLLDSPRAVQILAHWREVCAGAPTTLDLPTDRRRPARQALRGATHVFQAPADIVAGLRRASHATRTTPVRHLMAVFQALLHRYTRQQDFLLGCAATSTVGLGLLRQRVAGYYVNAIPLRARCTPGTTFQDVAAAVNRQLRDGMANVDYPFALLPQALGLARANGAFPLFQVMVSMVTVNRAAPLLALAARGHGAQADYAGLRVSGFEVPQQEGQFDLTMELVQDGTAIRCALKYDTDLFDAATIQRLAAHYESLLRAADAGTPFTQVPLVDDTERARLLAFAAGRRDVPPAFPEGAP